MAHRLVCCVLLLQEAYPARLMFGEALLSAVNVGQMLHAAESADDADKLRSKVGRMTLCTKLRIAAGV
jgi:hypothetical protein